MACLVSSMVAVFIAARTGSVGMWVCFGVAFFIFVILLGPVLVNQTIEVKHGFLIVRTFRRSVKLKACHLTEVVKRRDGSLAYRFHAGGILYYQVSPLAYYHAESLQKHFDRLFELDERGIGIREPGKQERGMPDLDAERDRP